MILFVVIFLMMTMTLMLFFNKKETEVTKKIWILWIQGWDHAPYIAKKVKESWEKHNPSYEVIPISENNIRDYLNDLEAQGEKSSQAYSDIIRIKLLEKYGGIWADATMLCMKPIENLVKSINSDTWMYRGGEQCKFVASWFIISKQNSYMIKKWKEKCDKYWKKRRVADEYLWLDRLWIELYHNDKKFKNEWDRTEPKLCCDDYLQPHVFAGRVNESDPELQTLLIQNKPYAIKLSHHGFLEEYKESNGNFAINISLEINNLSINDCISFIDKFGNEYSSKNVERDEQLMVDKYIEKNDLVLELGCRYGTVSCLLARKCKKLISIDPDKDAIEICKKNMRNHGVTFECLWCTVSKNSQKLNNTSKEGYGDFTEDDSSSDIPNFSINELESIFLLKFNTIVADCEGCLEKIIKENDMSNIHKIIYETDKQDSCDYEYISNELVKNGFKNVETVERGGDMKNIYWKKDN